MWKHSWNITTTTWQRVLERRLRSPVEDKLVEWQQGFRKKHKYNPFNCQY